MPAMLAALTLVLMMGMVVGRVLLLKRRGVDAMQFGKLDRTDFLIPPFMLFYFYMIFANAFGLPGAGMLRFFDSEALAWLGVLACAAGLVVLAWSLISFERSFRIGIDSEHPDRLITTGVFAFSRNPIYVAFFSILLGQFLVLPGWLTLIYLGGAAGLFHRQVLREEAFLKPHYGAEYAAYCARVRRYL